MEAKVLNLKGDEVGSVKLPENVFGVKPQPTLLHEVTTAHLSNQRAGSAHTKTRAEVSGGGKKPWKQKGTGRARQGSIRASHWVGGGKAMGPKPRDYFYRPPRQVRRAGICAGLSLRAKENKIIILNELVSDGKSKAIVSSLTKNLKLTSALLVDDKANVKLHRAVRNLEKFDALTPEGINLESVLRHKVLVMTQSAAKAINEALLKTRGGQG